ncbi:hypothetical protein CFC21_085108 [Triticum aestivum]|uniref:PUM-HD domain-containing protein n=2 Tax=Triticum aestivum TaxID=4565 RepID=A0A9R1IDB1_WHEAT|nr:hypothetical protein CFC21_085108 [Triticum aestivum]
MEEGERDDGFLNVLRALRDAARTVEAGEGDGPALRALLALQAAAHDLLAGDPELHPLCRLLATIRALSWRASEEAAGGGVVGGLRARCRRCKARRGIARAAGGVAAEIQAWADRELAARLVAALREQDDARARALLAELEARLLGAGSAGRFDARLQDAVLRHGVFRAVEARLGDPGEVGDGCAAAALALVRFNRDVFVGPVLMGPAVGALVAAAASHSSPAALRALNGLVAAVRTPLVDELHARGELPRLVALLCAPAGALRAPALELCLRVAYYGRREVLDALLAEGLVKRLLCLQRTAADADTTDTADEEEEKTMVASAVARFAVQVEAGQGLRPREKRAAKLEILRRVREAAVSPAEEAGVLTSMLWGGTP